MKRAPRFFAALALLVVSGASRQALASPVFELSGGVSGGGGISARTYGASAASTYFNPALLPYAEQSFELGVLVLADRIGITLAGRPSGDVPDAVGGRDLVDGSGTAISNASVPTRWLVRGCPARECKQAFAARPRQADGSSGNTRAYQVIGLVNHIIKERLVLGFYALVPLGSFTTARSFYNDEREQFFSNSLHPELYSDRLTATSLAFGGGGKLSDQVSIGLSFTLNLRNAATAGTYVRDADDYNQLLMTTKVDVHASVSPHVGVRYAPTDWLALTGTVHSKQALVIETDFKALLPSGLESATSRRSVHDFVPWTFGLGASADVSKSESHRFTFVAQGAYALWSFYEDRHGESPATYGHFLKWTNTLSGSVGARYETGGFRTMLDVGYVPTPVPPQTGRSNYVDNDRASVAAGFDYTFPVSGNVRLRAGLSGQAHILFDRYQEKLNRLIQDEVPDDTMTRTGQPIAGAAGLQTNNPGWPGFGSHGAILGGAASLALLY